MLVTCCSDSNVRCMHLLVCSFYFDSVCGSLVRACSYISEAPCLASAIVVIRGRYVILFVVEIFLHLRVCMCT
jgi:hypothetical protein